MGAKEYLSQALWLDQRINSKLELLETLRALAEYFGYTVEWDGVSQSIHLF
jgi:hypothetical protein